MTSLGKVNLQVQVLRKPQLVRGSYKQVVTLTAYLERHRWGEGSVVIVLSNG